MKQERLASNQESAERINFSPPVAESLLDPDQIDIAWPREVVSSKEFRSQIENRRKINERFDAIVSRLPRPDLSLKEAVEKQFITEDQVANLYESLSGLLLDQDYRRVLLYIPFEFLPNPSWSPSSETLKRSAEVFRSAYMQAWNALLSTHDVRANFSDGDVLEVESRVGDLRRVVKAAHLIPKLVESGLIKTEDALEILKRSDDEVLKQSIVEALLVSADLGFVQGADLLRIQTLDVNKPKASEHSVKQTKKRVAWLQQEKKRKLIEFAADKIGASIARNDFPAEMLAQTMDTNATLEDQQAFVGGVGKAVELLAHSNVEQAKSLYVKYESALISLWHRNVPEIREALTAAFCRLHGFDVISDEQLATLGISIPALAGPFSKNLTAASAEVGVMRETITTLESDPELSRYIYPVALMFGSRLKGYGTQNTDLDIAIFIKPDISSTERGNLRAALAKKFTPEKIGGEVVEFWLDKTGTGLTVRDSAESDPRLGESYWTHVLFGSAWEGDVAAIKELREKILTPYFYDTGKIIHGREARGLYLEELERDALQYRLMHKGYARFFRPYGGIHTANANRIDSQSMFWDSGYRQTALKLFLSRVFLPKISP